LKKYDYIPISADLIEHVRRLDGFNEDELVKLKGMMTQVARKMEKTFSFDDQKLMGDTAFRKFLEITLKIHQIFALVDVSYASVFTSGRGAQSLQAHF